MADAAPSQRRTKELCVFEESIEGLQDILGETFVDQGQQPIPCVVVSGQFALRELSRNTKGDVKYPFLALMITDVTESAGEGSNIWNKQAIFEGLKLGRIDSTGDYVYLHSAPITVTLQVTYMCQSLIDAIKFTKRWIFRERELQFKLANQGFNIGIKVMPSRQLSVPQQSIEDYGNLFVYETSIVMNTYVGEIEYVAAVKNINLGLKSINLNIEAVDSDNRVVPNGTSSAIITPKGKVTRTGS